MVGTARCAVTARKAGGTIRMRSSERRFMESFHDFKSRIWALNRLANGARLCVRSTPAAARGMEEGSSCFQASVV
jgi:hypothetical protein